MSRRTPRPATKAAVFVLATLVAVMAIATRHLSAQSGATVAITVRDQTGAVVPDAQLVLTGTNAASERKATGNNQGDAIFRLVPPGTYDLAASKDGFAPSTLRGIVVRDGDNLSLVVTLRVGELTEAVSVTGLGPYRTVEGTAGTKTTTPLLETPASIQVVPRAVIEDQKVVRLKEVLENVSGVQPQPSLGLNNTYIIRGFENRNRTYRITRRTSVYPRWAANPRIFPSVGRWTIRIPRCPRAPMYSWARTLFNGSDVT
jgi:outer membrane receptor protein involved in Fe transport